jgi:hypothetical protein
MSKLWTEKLARDFVLVGCTLISAAVVLCLITQWITPEQGMAVFWTGVGISHCGSFMRWRASKSVTALLPTERSPTTVR